MREKSEWVFNDYRHTFRIYSLSSYSVLLTRSFHWQQHQDILTDNYLQQIIKNHCYARIISKSSKMWRRLLLISITLNVIYLSIADPNTTGLLSSDQHPDEHHDNHHHHHHGHDDKHLEDHNHNGTNDHIHVEEANEAVTPFTLWLYGTGAVLFISVMGLMAIMTIPKIQAHHHGDVLQLLVGLAIGTLTSDALLHLLPHVRISHSLTFISWITRNLLLFSRTLIVGNIFFNCIFLILMDGSPPFSITISLLTHFFMCRHFQGKPTITRTSISIQMDMTKIGIHKLCTTVSWPWWVSLDS